MAESLHQGLAQWIQCKLGKQYLWKKVTFSRSTGEHFLSLDSVLNTDNMSILGLTTAHMVSWTPITQTTSVICLSMGVMFQNCSIFSDFDFFLSEQDKSAC